MEKIRTGKAGKKLRMLTGASVLGLLVVVALALSAASAFADPKQPLPPHFPEHPTTTPNWPPPNWPPAPGQRKKNPPATPTPTPQSGGTDTPAATGGVLGTSKAHKSAPKSHAPTRPGTVVVQPHPNPITHTKQHHKAPLPHLHPAAHIGIGSGAVAASQPEGNPNRSTLADRILSPTQIDLSAKNLGESGLLAFLLVALLYLPVTIFNKATEKNHESISRWFSRPHAALVWLMAPFRGHPLITLGASVLLSTALFSFVEPGFPHEDGALEYAIGMLIGFALVGTVFFTTWQEVLHKLEPHAKGHWVIYPPYIVLAAMLVVLARLAHFLPGVVLGTVAEYEPAHPLSKRTAGIRVAVTYGVMIVFGLAAWFAWIPVEHAASKPGASSLTLILDSALAITFVSALESVAFGLIPMTFLDGNDLYRWNKGIWAAMWSGAILWFSLVVLHPALSTYHGLHGSHAIWFGILFAGLMFAALATWGFFRVRDARLAHEAEQTGRTGGV